MLYLEYLESKKACVAMQELTRICNVSGDIMLKHYLVTKMDRYNKCQTKKYAHTLPSCARWWLSLGYMGNCQKDHPC